MKKVKFIFFEGISWSSRIIRWFTRSKFSHVGLYLSDYHILEVYHYDPVEIWKLEWLDNNLWEHKIGTKYVIIELEVTEEQYDKIYNFIKRLVVSKTKYDWKSVFKFVFKSKPKANDKYFCSEGCMNALKKAFPDRFNDINPATISPQMFYVVLKAMDGKIWKTGRV